jgi:hypothetical protein
VSGVQHPSFSLNSPEPSNISSLAAQHFAFIGQLKIRVSIIGYPSDEVAPVGS